MTKFRSFQKVFGEDAIYLSFLHLHGPHIIEAFLTVKEAISNSPDVEKELIAFLRDRDWRYHIVAAVSVGFFTPSDKLVKKLWETLDRGSWVTPQISAVLSLYDPDFQNQALIRLKTRCIIVNPPAFPSALLKHVEAGPANDAERSFKAASSLVSLLRACKKAEVQKTITSPEVRAMVRSDIDRGGAIATEWTRKFKRCIKQATTCTK